MARQSTSTAARSSNTVKVKSTKEVVRAFNDGVEYVFHTRTGKKLTTKTRKQLVAYGPWLAGVVMLVILPELLIFAKDSQLFGISSFFTRIFFNQTSWILMLVVLANCLLLADSISDIFAKKRRGWNHVYWALILNGFYIIAQIFENITKPAAPLLSLMALSFLLFILLDIKSYYKK